MTHGHQATAKGDDMDTVQHTSLPWRARGFEVLSGPMNVLCTVGCGLNEGGIGASEIREANAAFIVCACNCHEELLEALKKTMSNLIATGCADEEDLAPAKKAIAHAEGR